MANGAVVLRRHNNQNKRNNRNSRNTTRDSRKRQYRCSLKGLLETYNSIKCNLTPKHFALIAKTPFHLIFKAIQEEPNLCVSKKDFALDTLIQRYSSSDGGFRIGRGRYYRFEPSDIKLIFGLTDGNREIKMNSKVSTSEFTRRLFPGVRVVSVTMLKSKLLEICRKQDNISIEDTVRALCLLLIGSFLLPNTCTTIATTYYPLLDFVDDISNYNWSKAIADKLRHSLKVREGTDPKTVAGCTVFLLYWFFEHYEKMLPGTGQQIPRFRRWNMLEGCKRITVKEVDSILKTEFKQGSLQPSYEEMRDIGLVLLEDTKLLTQSTPGERERDTEEEDTEEWKTAEHEVEEDDEKIEEDEEIEQRGSQQQRDVEKNSKVELDKLKERNLVLEEENLFLNCKLKKLQKKVLGEASTSTCNREEEMEGLRKSLSESMDMARKKVEEVENLKKVLSEAISGDYKKDREEMQADIHKLHAQIEALNNEVGVEAKKRYALTKSSTHLLEEKKKLEGDLEIRMRHIEKQFEHVELLTPEIVAQKERIESMSKHLTGYIETVKKLEVDNWKLAEASSNQISEIGRLTEFITDLIIKIEEKGKDITVKQVKLSNLELVMKDLGSMVQFQDSESLDMPPREPEEEAAEMPPRKRVRSEFFEVQAPTKQRYIQFRELKVAKSEETPWKGKGKVIDVKDDTNEERPRRKGRVTTLKKKLEYDIGMFLTDEAYDKLARSFREEKLEAIVWQDQIRNKVVFLDYILQAMDNQFISSTVIDAYAIEICKKNPAIAEKSLFMSANCWDRFMRYASAENYNNELMDEIVSHASTKDLLFFPICTGGRHTSVNHYTLLVRDMKKNTWFFYNSMLLARQAKNRMDPYFSDAQKLVYYVDDGLRRRMVVNKVKHGTTWSKGSWIQCVTDIAQQPHSTNDCAALVCYYMFHIASGKQLKEKMDLTEVRKVKADLINTIIS